MPGAGRRRARGAQALEATLDVFSDRYLRAKQSVAPDTADAAHTRLVALGDGGGPERPVPSSAGPHRACAPMPE